MRKLFVVLTVFLIFAGCSYIYVKDEEDRARKYSNIEITLSDFSKKIIAYYERQSQSFPEYFDEKDFIELLEKVYPDQSKVESIKRDFKIKARSIDNNYSVVLCNPDTDGKLMEDLSCTLNRVDIRLWEKDIAMPCQFEENWEGYCK